MLSLVLPAYNEAAGLRETIEELREALDGAGIPYEMILVDNGSRDSTKRVISSLVGCSVRIKATYVPVNKGFGWGVLCGLREAVGDLVGYMASDGQITPTDVVRLAELLISQRCDIAKVRRDVREDGWLRRLQSDAFNLLMRCVFGIPFGDVNGSPKIMHRDVLRRLELTSRDWFLDAEIMIKAHKLGLTIAELPICFRARAQGRSNVSLRSIFAFLWNMGRYRFGRGLSSWNESLL